MYDQMGGGWTPEMSKDYVPPAELGGLFSFVGKLAGGAVKAATGIGLPSGGNKNAGRFATNEALATRARAGDLAAWNDLAQKAKTGWATKEARAHAAQLLAGIPKPSGAPNVNVAPIVGTLPVTRAPRTSQTPEWLQKLIGGAAAAAGGGTYTAPAASSGGGGGYVAFDPAPGLTPDQAAYGDPAKMSDNTRTLALGAGAAVLAAVLLNGRRSRR